MLRNRFNFNVALVKEPHMRIAIDLTPLLPYGENGGIKPMILNLIEQLAKLSNKARFILLTSDNNHKELASLSSSNISRVKIFYSSNSSRCKNILLKVFKNLFKLNSFNSLDNAQLLKNLKSDLLFCPFSSTNFNCPEIPIVSLICDLQYIYYPQFFSEEERRNREKNFKKTCNMADKIICISDFSKQTVLENSGLPESKVITCYIHTDLNYNKKNKSKKLLAKYSLQRDKYVLYPANFWLHKNHKILFTAFLLYRSLHPQSNLKLVCTGHPSAEMQKRREEVKLMGLMEWIIFPGYIAKQALEILFENCKALIFPSLYEGFGIPIIQAMLHKKPVLCSNVCSLPEIAGSSALYFDPKKPDDIANAIAILDKNPQLISRLTASGYQHANNFSNIKKMAQEYYSVFSGLVTEGIKEYSDNIYGLYEDGWIGKSLQISCSTKEYPRQIYLELSNPSWNPKGKIYFTLKYSETNETENFSILSGEKIYIRKKILNKGGLIEINFKNNFRPICYAINSDTRRLSCICKKCELISDNTGLVKNIYPS